MKKIGITGNIGSGKSQATRYLISRGYKVLDADALVAEIYDDPVFIKEMTETFGTEITSVDDRGKAARLDKKAVAGIVFNDPAKLELLNSTIAPYIRKKMDSALAEYEKTEEILFLDIPLLYEKDMQSGLDAVILVYCDDNIRYERAAQRDSKSEEDIRRIDSFQMRQSEKLSLADYKADNSGSLDSLYAQLEEILKNIENSKR